MLAEKNSYVDWGAANNNYAIEAVAIAADGLLSPRYHTKDQIHEQWT